MTFNIFRRRHGCIELLRAVAAVIAVSVSLGAASFGKQANLSNELVGCWQIRDNVSRSQRDLCLGKGDKVNAGWTNSEEGMYSPGTYGIKGSELTVYGTDGNGGPPRPDAVTHCRFTLVSNRSELILRDCAFEGDWKLLCRNLKTDAHGTPACIRYPAN
jgi:hypothetical protein